MFARLQRIFDRVTIFQGPGASGEIPRIIWILWLQGWAAAPAIVQASLKTWQMHNPGWTIRALERAVLDDLLRDDELFSIVARKNIEPEALADVVRIALLRRYGGIWADSTVYCLRPLDTWLDENMRSGFFAFARLAPERVISSWFLAAKPGNYIVEAWYRRCLLYWRKREQRHTYFWFHALFDEAVKTDRRFRKIWAETPQVSADGPHYFVPYAEKLAAPVSDADRDVLQGKLVPLLKLTHKGDPERYAENSCFNYLLRQASLRR